MTNRQNQCLDATLENGAANLALDEALLDAREKGCVGQTLRFWEPRNYFVVVGYANQVAREVNLNECKRLGIPVLRRCSGGGTVVQGPGCLNYTLVLDAEIPFETISTTNSNVMERNRMALERVLGRKVQIKGYTDLTVDNLKFSGNAQRRKRRAFIFHGTFLLNFDLGLVEKVLPMPSMEPDYRQNRSHGAFLTNLNVSANVIKQAMMTEWNAMSKASGLPDWETLSRERYEREEWNLKC